MYRTMVLVAGFLALGLTACQEPPTQQLTNAEGVLSHAVDAEAGVYAQTELEAARTSLAAAKSEIETQNGKFALLRRYGDAEKMLTEAHAKAEDAVTAAREGKEKARAQAESDYAEVQDSLTEAGTLLAELEGVSRKPKGFTTDLEAMHGRLDGLGAEASSIEDAIAAQKYLDAQSRAQSLRDQISPLVTDMQSVKEKLRG